MCFSPAGSVQALADRRDVLGLLLQDVVQHADGDARVGALPAAGGALPEGGKQGVMPLPGSGFQRVDPAECRQQGLVALGGGVFQNAHARVQLRERPHDFFIALDERFKDAVLLEETFGLGRDARVAGQERLARFGKRFQEAGQGRLVDLDVMRLFQVAEDFRLGVSLLEIQLCDLLPVGVQHRFGHAAPSVRHPFMARLKNFHAHMRNAAKRCRC